MLWTLLGRACIALAQAGLLVLAARLGSAEMVGDLALALALCSPIMVVAGLQLRVVYVTDLQRRFGWHSYAQLRRWASAGGVVLAIGVAAGSWLQVSALAVTALALAKAGELGGDLHHATFQAHGVMRLYARSVALRAGLGLAALGTVLATLGDLAAGLLAMAAVSWAVALLHDRPLSVGLRGPTRGPEGPAALLWTAAPLGLVAFVDSIAQQAARLQVDGLIGTVALGHYAVMSYAVVAGGAVVFSLGTPLLPRMAAMSASGRRGAFLRIALKLILLSVVLGLGGIAFAVVLGRPFLGLVFGAAFEQQAHVFPWVMTAGALHFVLGALMHAINAAQRRSVQPWIYLSALGVTLLAGWSWIPAYGLRGAAWASGLGWSVAVAIAATILATTCRRPA